MTRKLKTFAVPPSASSACRSRNACRTRTRRYSQAAASPQRPAYRVQHARAARVWSAARCRPAPPRRAMPSAVTVTMRPVMRASMPRG